MTPLINQQDNEFVSFPVLELELVFSNVSCEFFRNQRKNKEYG
jgi:hypothetical protein